MRQVSLKTKIALCTAIVLWASAFVGIRAGLTAYSPGGLATLRFLTASIAMFFIYQKFAKRDLIPFFDKLQLLLVGAFGVGWYNIALNYGEVSISSGVSSFVISQSPIITSIFAVLFLRESFSVLGYFGMMISLFGVSLISLGETKGVHFGIGILYVFAATVIGAFYSILQKPFLKKYHAIDVTAYIIWGGALMLFMFIPDLLRDIKTASLSATYSVIYLGIFPAAIAYVAWSYALAEIAASRAVSFLYFMPIIATFIGWIWLNEVPVLLSFIGGVVALLGVWVVNHSYKVKSVLEIQEA
jgi:drug/metabolite transporter (DMT)-like permease